ncbi:MAG: SEC-C metal-binding domain-containing protein, partial [Clostridia bacterium]|nr:SEC-C metal-binding domain-containing protein [Clostridia bacterium]
TIATNMAGRGTDIVLEEGVAELGGLFVLGTERHESRRIDNQLRGRSGRQGDPGKSQFFISLEDDLMRLFGSEKIMGVVDALGMEEDQPIEHKMLSSQIENAQKRIEGRNFGIRKHVLQYDDVMNVQRNVIYSQRQSVLEGEDLKDSLMNMLDTIVGEMVDVYTAEIPNPEEWDLKGLFDYLKGICLPDGVPQYDEQEILELDRDKLKEDIMSMAKEAYQRKEQEIGSDKMREVERVILLKTVDQKWMDHIDAMDQLRQGIGLRAYGQKDPVVEYKFEGYDMFQQMVRSIQEDTLKFLYHIQVDQEMPKREKIAEPTNATHGGQETVKQPVVKQDKIGRNDPCPCGSGKKYKKCCGRHK